MPTPVADDDADRNAHVEPTTMTPHAKAMLSQARAILQATKQPKTCAGCGDKDCDGSCAL